MDFSVLIAVFAGASSEEFSRALSSVWEEQTRRPSEIVLVIDGPIPRAIHSVVEKKKEELGSAMTLVFLSKNQGLGEALKNGVSKCNFDWVARMDADDYADKRRFEKQISIIESQPEIDIVGTYVQETIQTSKEEVKTVRRCPIRHDQIVAYAKKRCPFNHPTVMFRKEVILRAGNYHGYRNYQDYELWVRAIQSGAKCLNIPESLVFMKMDRHLIDRRGGLKYALLEYGIQRKFLASAFLTKSEFMRNIILRFAVRLLPRRLRRWVYLSLLRQ